MLIIFKPSTECCFSLIFQSGSESLLNFPQAVSRITTLPLRWYARQETPEQKRKRLNVLFIYILTNAALGRKGFSPLALSFIRVAEGTRPPLFFPSRVMLLFTFFHTILEFRVKQTDTGRWGLRQRPAITVLFSRTIVLPEKGKEWLRYRLRNLFAKNFLFFPFKIFQKKLFSMLRGQCLFIHCLIKNIYIYIH